MNDEMGNGMCGTVRKPDDRNEYLICLFAQIQNQKHTQLRGIACAIRLRLPCYLHNPFHSYFYFILFSLQRKTNSIHSGWAQMSKV